MGERLNLLAALTLAVQKEFDFIQIGMNPDADDLAIALLPIQCGNRCELVAPPGFVVVKIIQEKPHISTMPNCELIDSQA
jgi:hypothetical protein